MTLKKQYILVTKGSCPHCVEALSLLKEKELNFSYTDMEFNKDALLAVSQQVGWNTVPMIWEQEVEWGEEDIRVISNNFIGGCSELKEYLTPEQPVEEKETPQEVADEIELSEEKPEKKKTKKKERKKKVANA